MLCWADNIEKCLKLVDPLDVQRSAYEERSRRTFLEMLVYDEESVETRKYRILSRNADRSFAK
jgi:hypothetical protein